MDSTLIAALIGGAVALIGLSVQIINVRRAKKAEKEAQDKNDIANQIESFQSNLMEMNRSLQDDKEEMDRKIHKLKGTIDNLKEKVDTLKSGIMTLNLFGHNSPIAMWVKDQNGKRLYHNQAYEDLTGYLIKDCIGLTDYEITGNAQISQVWEDMDQQVKDTKQPMIDLEVYAHKDTPDDIKPIISFKWPVMLHSHVIGIEGAGIPVHDISHLVKQALDKTHQDHGV